MRKANWKKVVWGVLLGMCLLLGACGKKGPSVDELTADLSECICTEVYPYSIEVGVLVNSCIANYEIAYYTPLEAVEKGYIRSDLSVVTDEELQENTYIACVSGDVIVYQDMPEWAVNTPEALVVILSYDNDGNLLEDSIYYMDNNLKAGLLDLLMY